MRSGYRQLRGAAEIHVTPVIGNPCAEGRGYVAPVADAITSPVTPTKCAGVAQRIYGIQDVWHVIVGTATGWILAQHNRPIETGCAGRCGERLIRLQPVIPAEAVVVDARTPPLLHVAKAIGFHRRQGATVAMNRGRGS